MHASASRPACTACHEPRLAPFFLREGRRGVSGGMVFFYCLLSIVLAAGLVVGSKYGLIW
jgi:hypothetical protein